MRLLLLVILLIFLSSLASAFPQVNSVLSGVFEEGSAVSIGGSGFGTKEFNSPWIWDDLTHPSYANLEDGDWIPTRYGGSGTGYYNTEAVVIDPMALYGHASGWLAYRDSHPQQRVPGRALYSCEGFYATIFDIGRPHGDTEYLFLDYWFYSTSARSGGGGDQFNKLFRVSPSTSTYNRYGHTSIYPGRISYNAGNQSLTNPLIDDAYVYENIYPVEGEWAHISVWTDGSGDLNANWGESEGIFKLWTNNVLLANISDEGYNNATWTDDVMGFSFLHALGIEGGNSVEGHTAFDNLWGDIYLDNTLSRIAIGDAENWDQVSHYEMQIPSAWSTDSIDFKVNLGSFNGTESVYLFVFDSAGIASDGFPITIDQTISQTPTISSVTGTISDGDSITITGSSFGAKANAAPLFFSTFDNDALLALPPGFTGNPTKVFVSDSLSYSGAQSVQLDPNVFSQAVLDFGAENATRDLFVTANIMLEHDGVYWPDMQAGNCWQMKLWHYSSSADAYSPSTEPGITTIVRCTNYWCNGGNHSTNPYVYSDSRNVNGGNSDLGEACDVWYNGSVGNADVKTITYPSGPPANGYLNIFRINEWYRSEHFLKGSSAANIADGSIYVRTVGYPGNMLSETPMNFITYDEDDDAYRYFNLQVFLDDVVDNTLHLTGCRFFYDDVYIDNTQARIEVGNNEDFESCTVRDIQPPTAWTNTSVTITFNQGKFSVGDDAWVFVVDKDGLVSDGFPITIDFANIPGDLNGDETVNLQDFFAAHSLRDLLLVGRNILS